MRCGTGCATATTGYGYNLYGPTEYTINTLGGGTDDSATPTVGNPIWNTRAHILDRWLRPVPDGDRRRAVHRRGGPGARLLGRPALTRGAGSSPTRSGSGDGCTARVIWCPRARGRQPRLPRPHRRPGEDPRLPGRTRRHRDCAGGPSRRRAGRGRSLDRTRDVGFAPAGRLRRARCGARRPRRLIDELRSHLKGALPAYMVPAAIGEARQHCR